MHTLFDQVVVHGQVLAQVIGTDALGDFCATAGQVEVLLDLFALMAQLIDQGHCAHLFGEWNTAHRCPFQVEA
nr:MULTISPECIES: hypothetical protein [unclassified Pseudomonas]